MNRRGSGAACDVLMTHTCHRCHTVFQARPMRVLRAFLWQEALLCPTDPQTFSRVPTCYLMPDFTQFSYSPNCLDTSKCIFHKVGKKKKARVIPGHSALLVLVLTTAEISFPCTLQHCCLTLNTTQYLKLQTSTLNSTSLFGRKKRTPSYSKQGI